jgi:hypothetical protein
MVDLPQWMMIGQETLYKVGLPLANLMADGMGVEPTRALTLAILKIAANYHFGVPSTKNLRQKKGLR